MTTPGEPAVRIAKAASVCAGDGCIVTIWAGARIVRTPSGGWKHEDCDRPFKRSKADRAAARAAMFARNTRR
jgi:hypothetical protein